MIPDSLESLIERAIKYQKRGDYSRASQIYNGLLRRGYQSARVLTNQGAALYEAGKVDAGLDAFEAALKIDPTYKDAWNNLRVAAVSTDDWQPLLANAEQMIEVDRANKHAWHAKAQVLMAAGSFAASQAILTDLLSAHPDDLELRESMVRCNLASSDLDSALGHLLYILSMKPGDAFASIELAELAAKTGDLESSTAILQSAHALNPSDILIIQRIAREHQSRGNLHEALAMYELALSIDPDSPAVMAKKAYCHSEIGDVETFFEIYDQLFLAHVITPEMLLAAIFVCSTQGEPYLEKLRYYSDLYWKLFEHGSSPSAGSQRAAAGLARSFAVQPGSPRRPQRKKIGIVTGGLGTHVESCFLGSFLLNYSRDLFEVEVVSSRWLNDSISEVLSKAVDRCHSICGLSLQAARELIRKQDYDVIIETTGFTSGSAIHVLADRCAPVQCHWIGYHASTFMPTMDYFIGDSILTPMGHADRFSEQIVRLSRAWLAATPFTAIPEASSPVDSREVILGSFSQIAKLTSQTLGLWAQLLQAAPQCRLMLKDKFTNDPEMVKKIQAFFASRGVDPQRIDLKPRSSDWFGHMAMYNLIDISLDTTPWSSATTAFDALSMGVPLISIKGNTTSGLMSSSVLHHSGKSDWIASGQAEYIEKNLSLIGNVAALRRSRRELQGEILTSQLFDGPGLARSVEEFLLSV